MFKESELKIMRNDKTLKALVTIIKGYSKSTKLYKVAYIEYLSRLDDIKCIAELQQDILDGKM